MAGSTTSASASVDHHFDEQATETRARKPPRSSTSHARRHSLPLTFMIPTTWGTNSAAAPPLEVEGRARGEYNVDGLLALRQFSTLRQIHGLSSSSSKPLGHRYAKSTGARNSTYSQPVIVRTYSGGRPLSQREEKSLPTPKEKVELPPVEAFSFKGIMDSIQHSVAEDLERIAEICARSRYSLSNQYEVHMPPHGSGSNFLKTHETSQAVGPTLEAVTSEDEQSKPPASVRHRGVRRVKSAAYGTLETIMSSSRSSDEDKSKKKPAADIVEVVRGRAMRKDFAMSDAEDLNAPKSSSQVDIAQTSRRAKHGRSKSANLALMVFDNDKGDRAGAASTPQTPTATLVSEAARPQTSVATKLTTIATATRPRPLTAGAKTFPLSFRKLVASHPPSPISAASTAYENENRASLWDNVSSWMPWNKPVAASDTPARMRSGSIAEGTLRQLLSTPNLPNQKGKGVDRLGD